MKKIINALLVATVKTVEKWFKFLNSFSQKPKIDYQKEFKKIALICTKPLGLGDFVTASPFIKTIRQSFPDSEIHLITDKDLYDSIDEVNKIFYIKGSIPGLKNEFARLAVNRYDLGVVMQRGINQAWYVNKLRTRYKIGYLGGLEILANFSLVKPGLYFTKKEHLRNMSSKIADAMGLKRCETLIEPRYPDMLVKKAGNTFYGLNLDNSKKTIFLNAFVQWESRRWHEDNYVHLAKRLSGKYNFVLTGGADSIRLNSIIEKALAVDGMNIPNLSGKLNLKEFACFLKYGDLFITSDCGPMHFAFMMKCPTLAFFGPVLPEHRLPFEYERSGLVDYLSYNDYKKGSLYNYESRHFDPALNGLLVITVDDVIKKIEGFFSNGRFTPKIN